MVEIMAEVTHSFAERYDMEFERLGDVKCHIHMLYPANPKIMPWQLARMLKSITGREVLGGPGLQETVMVRRFLFLWLLCVAVVERRNWRIVQPYVQEPGKVRQGFRQFSLF